MANVEGLHPELRQRLAALMADPRLRGRVWIRSGLRTYEEQVVLWNRYQAYLRGGPFAPIAARPGTSNHERRSDGWGHAADLDFSPHVDEWGLLEAVAREYGLYRTVPSEGWHYQLDPRRGPLPDGSVPDTTNPEAPELNTQEKLLLEAAAKDAKAAREIANAMWAKGFEGGSLQFLDDRLEKVKDGVNETQKDRFQKVHEKIDAIKAKLGIR